MSNERGNEKITRREKSLLKKQFARLLKDNGFYKVKKVGIHESRRSVGGYEFEVTMKHLDMNTLTSIEQRTGYAVTDISPNHDIGVGMIMFTGEKGLSKKHVTQILKQNGFPDIKVTNPIYGGEVVVGFDVVNNGYMSTSVLANLQQKTGYSMDHMHVN